MTDIDTESQQLSVVIPAYNEEGGLRATLDDLLRHLPHAEIIVVDDGSRDNTLAVARSIRGIRLLSHRFNRGYGGALKTGMQAAQRPYVAWFDADNEHRAEDLRTMLHRIITEPTAAIVGERGYSTSTVRRFGKFVIKLLARSLGVRLGRDINCGLRVFRREVIVRYQHLLPNAYSASLTSTLILAERGYPLAFHPISLNRRIGQSKVQLAHGFQSLALVLRMVMLFAPLRIFLTIGAVVSAGGLGYGLLLALRQGQGFPALATLVTLLGVLCIFLGLIADQISQIRLSQLNERDDYRAHVLEELT
jgi:glycosyltransferase involved in cell wall biosynthesis